MSTNKNSKIIAVYDNDKMITRVLDIDLLDSVKNENYKIYDIGYDISKDMSIDAFDDDGKVYANSILFDKGLLELPDGKKLDGENIVDKTEVDFYNDDPTSEVNILKTIDVSLDNIEYVRDKTMLEKYDDGLATKDEYNAYQKSQRNMIFENKLDKELTILDNELKRGEITQEQYDEGFAEYMEAVEAVREQYAYVE